MLWHKCCTCSSKTPLADGIIYGRLGSTVIKGDLRLDAALKVDLAVATCVEVNVIGMMEWVLLKVLLQFIC